MANTYTMISKKFAGLFILLGLFWLFSCCGGKQYISASAPITQQQHELGLTLLCEEIPIVAEYIKGMVGKKTYLVLGVDCAEEDLDTRFSEKFGSYIFLNEKHDARYGFSKKFYKQQSLSVDFNNLTQLQYLANKLPGAFDQIILDDSTFKFTRWTKEYLAAFRDLLKINGEFIFAPKIERVAIGAVITSGKGQEAMLQEAIDNIISQTQPSNSEILIAGDLMIPLNFALNAREFLTTLLRQVFVPKNYVPILEQAFGTGNIQVENNAKLPFASHWSKDGIQPVLITATRR